MIVGISWWKIPVGRKVCTDLALVLLAWFPVPSLDY